MRLLFSLCLFCFLANALFAQQPAQQGILVKGKVISKATSQPLPGATITIKGSKLATTTDAEGNYSIEAPAKGSILIVSYIGSANAEGTVGSSGMLDFQLTEINSSLNEVVVIGYGTQKKSVVTGAISAVKATDLESMPVNRIEQSLQGRTSGVTIASSSGQPGAGSTLRIRGTTSINNSDPLYIVDGVPVDPSGIGYLNQYDIESIEVLKDAASGAIYGTKAASGVILITTKKGKAGALQVSYNGYYGKQEPAKKLKLLDATQYATLRNESITAAYGANDPSHPLFANPSSYGKGTDWQGLIFNNNARIQDHEVGISGGSDKSTYYASFGFFDQQGIVATPISSYKRFTARFNSAHKIKNWLQFGNNFSYEYAKTYGALNTNSEFGGPLSSAINLDPITPAVITDPAVANGNPYSNNPVIRDANGNPYGISNYVGQEMTNPLAYIATRAGNYNYEHNLIGNVYGEVELIKGLKFRSAIGAKLAFWGNTSFTPIYFLSNTQKNLTNTSYFRELNQGMNWNWDNTLTYTHSFGLHNFTALAGANAQEFSSNGVNGTYLGLDVTSIDQASFNFSLSPTNRIAGGGEGQPHSLSSYFGRLTYDYDGKYLLTAIIRRDGSSRFGSNNKYANFPSASVGWVPSKERFWPVNNVVNFAKIRVSYGVTGNENFGDFKYVQTISGGRNYPMGSDNILVGNSPDAPANPDLKWERTTMTDAGFDATVFRNFTVTFDVYKKKTTGMLLQIQLPQYAGVTGQPWGNVADLEDKGIELELGYTQKVGAVNISLKGNGSYVKNTITGIGANKYLWAGSFQASAYEIARTMVGHPIGAFYGFKTLGIFQTQSEIDNYVDKNGNKIQPNAKPGDFKFADLANEGAITSNSRTFIGDPTPHWTYGFTASADWNNFDLRVFGLGVAGNDIFQGLRRLDILTGNYTTAALGRWAGQGTSNTFPRLIDTDPNGNFTKPSAFYLSKGAYFRIKTLQIGYTLPRDLTKQVGLSRVRAYLSSNNLFTATKYTGYDPEIGGSSYGIDRGIYPQARSFTAGLNVTF